MQNTIHNKIAATIDNDSTTIIPFCTITDAAKWLYNKGSEITVRTLCNKISKAIRDGSAVSGYHWKNINTPSPIATRWCRKIDSSTAAIIDVVRYDNLDRHCRECVNKDIKYGGYIWEEIYPNEPPKANRYEQTLTQRKTKEAQQQYAERINNIHTFSTCYLRLEVHGEYRDFNNLDDALIFFSNATGRTKDDLAKLLYKSIGERNIYQKYAWNSPKIGAVKRDIKKFLRQVVDGK